MAKFHAWRTWSQRTHGFCCVSSVLWSSLKTRATISFLICVYSSEEWGTERKWSCSTPTRGSFCGAPASVCECVFILRFKLLLYGTPAKFFHNTLTLFSVEFSRHAVKSWKHAICFSYRPTGRRPSISELGWQLWSDTKYTTDPNFVPDPAGFPAVRWLQRSANVPWISA